ncbi:MAG TPA: hypothetical protein VFL91_21330 [Thermomicrobiales bacterium]|nr:hypothetical protein [Thermomicrobiales bacterium]
MSATETTIAVGTDFAGWPVERLRVELHQTCLALAAWRKGDCGVQDGELRLVGVRVLGERLAALTAALAAQEGQS